MHASNADTPQSSVVELGPGQTERAHAAMLELRPDLPPPAEFAKLVDDVMRPEGFRLVVSLSESGEVAAVAGFRIEYVLARGRNLYVDDLVTVPAHRRAGHADRLLSWLLDEARRAGCRELHLDSAPHRHDAHRFYLNHGLHISAYHFRIDLSP